MKTCVDILKIRGRRARYLDVIKAGTSLGAGEVAAGEVRTDRNALLCGVGFLISLPLFTKPRLYLIYGPHSALLHHALVVMMHSYSLALGDLPGLHSCIMPNL